MLEKLNALGTPAKLAVAFGLAIAIAGGLYYFVVMGMQEQNKTAQAALDQKIKENTELKQYESKLPDLERQIASLKQQMELQKKIVPDEKDADKFIILLQEAATTSNIQLRKIEAKGVITKEYVSEAPFAVEMDGPYYGVLSFFEKLRGQTRIVNVDGITLKTAGKTSKYSLAPTDSVSVSATAKTFFSREISATPAAPAAAKK